MSLFTQRQKFEGGDATQWDSLPSFDYLVGLKSFVYALGLFVLSFGGMVPGIGDRMRVQFYRLFQGLKPGTAEIVNGYFRGKLNYDQFLDQMLSAGFGAEDAGNLLSWAQRAVNVQETLTLWYRYQGQTYQNEEINADWLTRKLEANGVATEDVDLTLEANRPIPNLQDIISFATREVWHPTIVKRERLDDERPVEYMAEAKKRGLNEEDAAAFWRAHWTWPSIQMAFEMYHRLFDSTDEETRFDEDRLKYFFDVTDIAPGIRKSLTAISYHPLTRVDVRRMYRLGVFDKYPDPYAALIRAYREIGYDETNAELMAEFTKKYETESERDATRAMIEKFWRSGALGTDRDDVARSMLLTLGYQEDVVEYILTDLEIQEIDAEETAEILEVEHLWNIGEITTTNELIARLAPIGLPSSEVNSILRRLKRGDVQKIKRLSRSECDRLVRAGEMKEKEYTSTLVADGYRPGDAKRLFKTVALAEPSEASRPSKTDLVKWYDAEIITASEFLTMMKDAGFKLADIARYAESTGKPILEGGGGV